jgi:predicted peptidase
VLENMVFDQDGGNRIIYGEWLQTAHYADLPHPLSCVYYEPEVTKEEKIPLIIWLHGAGEGGAEPAIAAVGNKVVNLISPKMQSIFGGKAYLLAPQSPTMWMDDGSGEYTNSGISMYAESLETLIDSFVKSHPSIDQSRIYLGGCSNGGFMTMRMLLYNPNRYAAAFPVCEALYDQAITDDEIRTLAGIPIWFVHSKNDPVVKPEDYVLPTYHRIRAANASDVHMTYYDRIVDQTGLYKDEDGNPYEYIGHWAWIPMLNNECTTDFDGSPVMVNGKPASILEWLASHKKQL